MFENVAFPLRAHTRLPEPLLRRLVLMKLQAVGLRGAADMATGTLSGGMARRVALARAIVMDPELLIYDEPFVGLDPISLGVILRLIETLNATLGITSIVVTHDVEEISRIAHQSYLLAGGRAAAAGTPAELRATAAPAVKQFMKGLPDGPVPFHVPAPDYRDAAAGYGSMNSPLGRAIVRMGRVALFLLRVLGQCLPSLRHPRLLMLQVYNAGARSLIIVMLCGLFVGMVLGLQGYDLLQRFGSESALGVAAALGLVRELGPVITALLFAGRAGTSLTSEIGLMRATDQLTAMEMMAVDPVRRVVAPRFLGGIIAMPLLTAIFNVIGIFGAQLIGVGLIGVESGSFWSQMQSSVERGDINEGLIKSLCFGVACSLMAVYEGYHAEPTAEGVGLATTRTVVSSAVLTLLLDYMLTAAFLNS